MTMSKTMKTTALAFSVSFAALNLADLSHAADQDVAAAAICESDAVDCHSDTQKRTVGRNTEMERPSAGAQAPVSISVDGETVFGTRNPADGERATDVALEKVDVQVKYDGLGVVPALNVSTWPPRRAYAPGEDIRFLASSNYPAWISRAEIRIFEKGSDLKGFPLFRIAVGTEGDSSWKMPAHGPADFVYLLRVVDDKGRYDETRPLSLARSKKQFDPHATDQEEPSVAPGYGEDRTAFRNIPVYGGAVTVYGKNVPDGHNVHVLGDSIPIDPDGAFVVQRILPPGDHLVDVEIADGKAKGGQGLTFNRDINIPSSEWFYVALADLTVGRRFASGHIEDVKPGEFDKVYTKGRLAFYVKGKIKGRYLLTAAADTGEDKVQNLFKGIDSKDPRQFLNRIDPEEYYPIYGDDSVSVEDAPTRGKFYVRVERGDSHVMWGNFKANITGTTFLRNERALYGASAAYRSTKSTQGERSTELQVYAAQPGTLPQRDIFKGTGGSAYFLSHQDVTVGSETITVEVRDPVTNVVLSRRSLRLGFDYEIDYIQGLILLKAPLSSSTSAIDVVRGTALGGAAQYLVVNYEFTPTAGDADGYVLGGRAQQWIGNNVRVGVTGQREKTGAANQTLYGADILVKRSARTYVEGEIAQSRGPGFGNAISTDGGLTINNTPTSGVSGKTATAYRVHGGISMEDLTGDRVEGDISAYYERKQGGFSSLDEQVTTTKRVWGADGEVRLTDSTVGHVKFDDLSQGDGKKERELDADATYYINKHLSLTPGIKLNERRDAPSTALTSDAQEGRRVDVGGIIKYEWDEHTSAYVLAQTTVKRTGSRKDNDRIGIGGEVPLTEKVSAYGEVSTGSTGFGGKAGVDYHPTADDHYYLGYKLDPDRENAIDASSPLVGRDMGVFVAGAEKRINEGISVFSEDRYDIFGRKRSLTQAYGVKYTPTAAWNVSGGVEIGDVTDETINSTTGFKNSDFERQAVSLAVGYHGEDNLDAKIKGEYRRERSDDGTRDSDTYVVGAGLSKQAIENWRALLNVDAVISKASKDTLDGKYLEATAGLAYRPVESDYLNALFKYAFLYDLPGADQVTVNGTTLGPAQMSHILSADINYDLSKIVTLGAKYGFRFGKTKPRDGSSGWENSSAQIAILRADLHIVNHWDALVEGRVLWNEDGANWGALAAVYREVGENFKVGVGYNFGKFSDDLRDLTYDDHGIFVNAIGQF
jgi:hypothetical protein